jgi:unsaturated rhamnogalacturonyl hydrolase
MNRIRIGSRCDGEVRKHGAANINRVVCQLIALALCLHSVSAAEPRERVKTVADAVLRDFPKAPPFNWGEGVLLTGMMRSYLLTKDDRYLQFVRRFADHWSEQGIGPTLKARGYCGHWGPGFPLLMLYEVTRDDRHRALAGQVVDFMLHQAERTKDGGLSHFNGKPQLWVDTLDMCCPVLSNAARLMIRPEWQREAVRQWEVFAKHLQDPASGLYYHMWDEASGERTPAFWARGNGWVVMALTEMLKNEQPGTPERAKLRRALEKYFAALAPLQDKQTGLWRTVLDSPATYFETSATAMFLYGMAECRNRKLADVRHAEIIRGAWAGLSAQVDPEGRVIGVSAGTGPSTKERYARVKVGTYTWGTGAYLLAACAMAESDRRP